jgi:hypothetical protein
LHLLLLLLGMLRNWLVYGLVMLLLLLVMISTELVGNLVQLAQRLMGIICGHLMAIHEKCGASSSSSSCC